MLVLSPTRSAAGRTRREGVPPPSVYAQPSSLWIGIVFLSLVIWVSVSCCAVIGAARLTLEQLAEMSGVSARTLSDMERGRSKGPQHRTVTALADTLALEGDVRKRGA
jgi:DNA-binding XRE family transcriptional regulator